MNHSQKHIGLLLTTTMNDENTDIVSTRGEDDDDNVNKKKDDINSAIFNFDIRFEKIHDVFKDAGVLMDTADMSEFIFD